ncbi:MAG: 3'-phosphoesterase [Candidatus Aminicenantes bacterium]|nr:3'-phosphoesterase [Candidatus Aminicenantes bacterium]
MGLKQYRDKRRFDRTPEPGGHETPESPKKPVVRESRGQLYVIQKHQASHLHWDLRLEEGGVLRSWAVPKEPPEIEGLRRLAVQVEDHPLDYAAFEGVIPKGEYGAGTVEIWDRGTYRALETTETKRIIDISGTKLSGSYILLKLKPKDPKDKNWLFFKSKTHPQAAGGS